jgi:glycosyltransferase involved in cell wall biosynthesis
MKPLVSILIPCFNAEKWLGETIKSALSQTWQNIEIILVDDGSTDDSLSIAKAFESHNVKVISQKNQGGSAARNQALKISQGDFIQYLDADDLLAPEKIELQMQCLEQEQIEYLAAGEWARFYNTPSEARFISQPPWVDMKPLDWLVCTWGGNWMMHPAAWLIPREISNRAGYWNESLSLDDDGEYFCRVVLASQGIKFCNGAKTYYRSGLTGTVSSLTSDQAWRSALDSINFCTASILNKEQSFRTRQACASRYQRFIYSAYPNVSNLIQEAEHHINELGGSTIQPEGGWLFQTAAKLLGWKNARLLQLYRKNIFLAITKTESSS